MINMAILLVTVMNKRNKMSHTSIQTACIQAGINTNDLSMDHFTPDFATIIT